MASIKASLSPTIKKKRNNQADSEVLVDKKNHTYLGFSTFLLQIFDSNFTASILIQFGITNYF